jgi:hypothetical protein
MRKKFYFNRNVKDIILENTDPRDQNETVMPFEFKLLAISDIWTLITFKRAHVGTVFYFFFEVGYIN